MDNNQNDYQNNSEGEVEIDDLELETEPPKIKEEKIEDEEEKADDAEMEKKESEEENISVPKSKVIIIKNLLANIEENSEQLTNLLAAFISPEDEARIGIAQISDEGFAGKNDDEQSPAGSRIVEGVFDGEGMVGPDGKQYSVLANYASKSKLVEGDIMKLTITPNGTFVYKQIGPIERSRLVGNLEQNAAGNFTVVVDGHHYKVLTASVTYYKGQAGDEVVILVPKSSQSSWAAVENIVRKIN